MKISKSDSIFEGLRIRKVGIYARISTSRKGQPKSIDSQIGKLIEYVENMPNLRLSGIYIDIGSGKKAESRRQLMRLIEDCRKGEIDNIITKSISRFARNTVDLLVVCRELRDIGVDVHFINEDIHSKDMNGELNMTLVAAVAESESYVKSENIKWGIAKSVMDPGSKFYSRVCYGYEKDKNGNLVIIETEAQVVRKIFQMYLDGYGAIKIKAELEKQHIPSPSGGASWPKRTIEKMLENEKYCGSVIFYKTYTGEYPSDKHFINKGEKEKKMVEGHHEPIVSPETFQKVQEIKAARKHKKPN